jgi:hypothetical protein
MKKRAIRGWGAVALLAIAGLSGCRGPEKPVAIAAGIDHASWSRLLRKYVDTRGFVDYARWKSDAADRADLRNYLARIGSPASEPAMGSDADASLINAYNAFVISSVLDDYPIPSIRHVPYPFSGRRHTVAGRSVSLDEIEQASLRPQLGFLTPVALTSGARSSPPLAAEAYRSDQLTNQVAFALRRFLDRSDLNEFLPNENRVRLSPVFRRYAEDFERAPGGLRGVLALYAPARYRTFLAKAKFQTRYQAENWALNDQGTAGDHYGGWSRFWDRLRRR